MKTLVKTLALLNTTIATTDGTYEIKTVSLDEAKLLVQSAGSIDSAIGHESTARVMTTLLGVDIEVDRQTFAQKTGQTALVFKLNERPPEGAILSEEELGRIGYTFKTMVRTV